MSDHSLILSAWEVRALLAGATQIRRAVRLPPCWSFPPAKLVDGRLNRFGNDGSESVRSPFGVPGDTLVCRETWADYREYTEAEQDRIDDITQKFFNGAYTSADVAVEDLPERSGALRAVYAADFDEETKRELGPWRSPATMPRWACRLTPTVVEVRCQRLQDVTEEDAEAMGPPLLSASDAPWITGGKHLSYRAAFFAGRDSTHRPGERWEDNPWVFAATVRRIG